MGIKELLHAYHGLEPPEQAAFAAIVRAHQLFNAEAWRQELARRSRQLENASATPIVNIERLATELEVRK